MTPLNMPSRITVRAVCSNKKLYVTESYANVVLQKIRCSPNRRNEYPKYVYWCYVHQGYHLSKFPTAL